MARPNNMLNAGLRVKWDLYTQIEDLAIKLDKFLEKIGEPDPVTGCQYPTHGGRHKQGYLMVSAHDASSIGQPGPHYHKRMVTGHRILARMKFKQPITPDIKVYHTCGDMSCMNIDHIAMGTQQEVISNRNVNGSTTVNRYKADPKAPKYAKVHYSVPDLFWIRDVATPRQIRDRFGLTQDIAYQIKYRTRKMYKWLDDYNPDGSKK